MKKWKKLGLGLLGGMLGICMIPVIVWFFPFPIEGNWIRPWLLSCRCKPDCYSFLRFEDGKILQMSNTHFPPTWIGTYQRKGWGKYETEEFGSGDVPSIVYSSYLRIATSGAWRCSRILRNPLSVCREVANHPSNDWIALPSETWVRIAGNPENRIFHSWRAELTTELLEAKLDCLFRQPSLQIYTASNEVPSPVLEVLDGHRVGYTIHANQEWLAPDKNQVNQEWVVPDTLKTNPIWRAIDNRTRYGLIITPPFWQPRFGDHRDEPFIYFGNEGCMSFVHIKGMIDSHRRRGDNWKNKLRLYVENGVLPEDVKQLFDPFDLEYTVLDERVLYRGKRKDPYAKKGDTP